MKKSAVAMAAAKRKARERPAGRAIGRVIRKQETEISAGASNVPTANAKTVVVVAKKALGRGPGEAAMAVIARLSVQELEELAKGMGRASPGS